VLLRVRDGETITAREGRYLVILAERHDVTITWTQYATGESGPGLHVHREHTDAFYVLDGELTFAVGPEGAERLRLAAGGFVTVPPNLVHTYLNDSGADARWLNLHVPDTGFAGYLRGLRDGTKTAFDQFDPPADGGRPASDAIVARLGDGEHVAIGDGVVVAERERGDEADLYYELGTSARCFTVSTTARPGGAGSP
jgi:quercetin dioxygenase-like cupin family protein